MNFKKLFISFIINVAFFLSCMYICVKLMKYYDFSISDKHRSYMCLHDSMQNFKPYDTENKESELITGARLA